MEILTISEKETEILGSKIASQLKNGDLILLEGELGSGKTFLTRSIGKALGIPEREITSPTFSIMQEYFGSMKLIHGDLYRLDSWEACENLGIYDYFSQDGVVILEWAKRFEEFLPEEFLVISIKGTEESGRIFDFSPYGIGWKMRIEQWEKILF